MVISMKILKYLSTVILIIVTTTFSHSSYAISPRLIPKSEKFEGWYLRLTDHKNKRSIAVVGGSFMKTRGRKFPKKLMQGYLAVIIADNQNQKTDIYEIFPDDTTYTTNGKPQYGTTNLVGNSTFRWESKSFGTISNDKISIFLPGALYLEADMGPRLPWDQEADRVGPEGIILKFPFIPAHWFVHSLGSPTNYRLTFLNSERTTWEGIALTHQEKNWGAAFPTAWIWSQGIGEDNQTEYALAGGKVKLPGLKTFTSWLVGIRGHKVHWDFRQSRISTTFHSLIKPCQGLFRLVAQDLKHQVIIEAQAPTDSFGFVSIPTKNGFKSEGGVESFYANVTIQAFLKKRGKRILQEVLKFKRAALEFGAGYMCPNTP